VSTQSEEKRGAVGAHCGREGRGSSTSTTRTRGRLMGGPEATVRGGGGFIPIQTKFKRIQIISNLIHPKKGLLKIENFEIKYIFEGCVEKNNFLHMNFS
jgi:hypothetical protein